MKHQAITKLKFKTLAARLSMPLWQVVGLLESLWLFAIHHARDGYLADYSPQDIAAWIEYSGDADQLVDSLVVTRWLDRGTHGDIAIHDWNDHKPTWLKGIVARELSTEETATNDATKSPTKSTTKSTTKQVGLGLVNRANNSKGKRAKKFTKPTAGEVEAYCRDRDNGITGEEFCDHYDGNGWKCGKNQTPMSDWKATVRTWERKRRKDQPAAPVAPASRFLASNEEYEALRESGELDDIIRGTNGRHR